MGKRNPMLEQIEQKWQNYYRRIFQLRVAMMMQMGQDAGMMAAYDACQMTPEQAKAFAAAYKAATEEFAAVVYADQQDDEQFWYAKHWRDERIRLIVGEENFEPWDECYATK